MCAESLLPLAGPPRRPERRRGAAAEGARAGEQSSEEDRRRADARRSVGNGPAEGSGKPRYADAMTSATSSFATGLLSTRVCHLVSGSA
jgi:hypothetical protein